jgi:hypothetical protein
MSFCGNCGGFVTNATAECIGSSDGVPFPPAGRQFQPGAAAARHHRRLGVDFKPINRAGGEPMFCSRCGDTIRGPMRLNTLSVFPHQGEPSHNRRVICEECASVISAFLDTFEEPAPRPKAGRTLAAQAEAAEEAERR